MGKHTKFDSSDDEVYKAEKRDKKDVKKEKKKEKRDRSRSPHKESDRSPKTDRHEEKNDSRRREDNDHGRRRDHGRDDRRDDRRDGRRDERREDRRGDRRDDRNNWKRDKNDRNDRRNDYQKREDKNRLSAEEIAAQRKALWGNKKPAAETPSNTDESTSTSSEAASGGKNEKLWSSAIAATGVNSSQANKFMRLMGVKNAPKPTSDSSNLSAEKNRQDKMLNDLEKQYAIARETTHMGRGTGFGFGH
ncbi:hypothetical protein CAEBREN_07518 [Caenorhabditis brenneri]|uniref:Small acidic protein-like domain-containing protein n=1 Tax=Caenorhabditis brenneri TaxID=135651 RepID=G0N5K2_CAEBE|nr:hypothetical protein CAEBREN_07518 [Caenorhabditis brenneri]